MSNLNDVFGSAGYGSEIVKRNWIKFPKGGGSLVLRVLPPYGTQKSLRKGWAKYYEVHFGYRDLEGKMRTFQSCQVKEKGLITISDPAVERIAKIKKALDEAKASGNKALVDKLTEQSRIYNVDKKFYLNVMDLTGKLGVLAIPYKMKQALEAEIDKLTKKGKDPLSVKDGVFFTFTRTGTGPTTTHNVSVYQEEIVINGMEVKVDKTMSLPEDVAGRIKYEGADLGDLYPSLTREEIQQIVTEGAPAVSRIFASKRGQAPTETPDYEESSDMDLSSAETSTTESFGSAETSAKAEENSQALAEGETSNAQLSDEDFLKSMGL